jgi:hypothetical protein
MKVKTDNLDRIARIYFLAKKYVIQKDILMKLIGKKMFVLQILLIKYF